MYSPKAKNLMNIYLEKKRLEKARTCEMKLAMY